MPKLNKSEKQWIREHFAVLESFAHSPRLVGGQQGYVARQTTIHPEKFDTTKAQFLILEGLKVLDEQAAQLQCCVLQTKIRIVTCKVVPVVTGTFVMAAAATVYWLFFAQELSNGCSNVEASEREGCRNNLLKELKEDWNLALLMIEAVVFTVLSVCMLAACGVQSKNSIAAIRSALAPEWVSDLNKIIQHLNKMVLGKNKKIDFFGVGGALPQWTDKLAQIREEIKEMRKFLVLKMNTESTSQTELQSDEDSLIQYTVVEKIKEVPAFEDGFDWRMLAAKFLSLEKLVEPDAAPFTVLEA